MSTNSEQRLQDALNALPREVMPQRDLWPGIAHALINTGEWSSLGQAEGGRDWTLGIADPHQADRLITRLRMRGGCVATSADDQCSFSADRVHHHILNPDTGYSPTHWSSVTVIAPSCVLADALTKVLALTRQTALPCFAHFGAQAFITPHA